MVILHFIFLWVVIQLAANLFWYIINKHCGGVDPNWYLREFAENLGAAHYTLTNNDCWELTFLTIVDGNYQAYFKKFLKALPKVSKDAILLEISEKYSSETKPSSGLEWLKLSKLVLEKSKELTKNDEFTLKVKYGKL